MTDTSSDKDFSAAHSAVEASATVGDYFELLKPRVMVLVVFTGLAGLLLAPGTVHPVLGMVAILSIAVASGAAGAINMWYDRDIDAVMKRTQTRPIPDGRVHPAEALGLGVVLTIGSVVFMGLALNWVAAGLLAFASGFYVFVYTMWLKRRTPQNIVIGGAAGAFPPLIGWAAVTGDIAVAPLILFALIFMWTPPHFWALALYSNEDYTRARVPMLPVVAGPEATRRHILGYSLTLLPLAVAPAVMGVAGWIYGALALVLSAIFIALAWRLWSSGSERVARQLFAYSILYLFVLFALLIVDNGNVPLMALIR